MNGTVILRGVVGSVAYGLAHEGSDVDRLGTYIAPTEAFLGLTTPEQTHVTHEPDMTMHEVGKLASLLLRCNPTVSELLWLSEYEIMTKAGAELVAMRHKFLSAKLVRDAYFGYATQQFHRLKERGGTFSSDLAKRTEKHARHLFRLLDEGYVLYTTGKLEVRVKDPEACRAFERDVAADPTVAEDLLAAFERLFDSATTALPEKPDTEAVNDWLVDVRKQQFLHPVLRQL